MTSQLFEHALVAVLSISLLACGRRADTPEQAKSLANHHVKEAYSLDDLNIVDVSVADEGPRWKVTYSAKGEALGGPIVVEINKNTGEIENSYGAQ